MTRAVFAKRYRAFQCKLCDGMPLVQPSSFDHVDSWRIACENWTENDKTPHSRVKLPHKLDYHFLRFLSQSEMTTPLPQHVLDAIERHAETVDDALQSDKSMSSEDALGDAEFEDLMQQNAFKSNFAHIPAVAGFNRALILQKVEQHTKSASSHSNVAPIAQSDSSSNQDAKTDHSTPSCNNIWYVVRQPEHLITSHFIALQPNASSNANGMLILSRQASCRYRAASESSVSGMTKEVSRSGMCSD